MVRRWIDTLDIPVEVLSDGNDTALTAARRPVQIIEGIPDADLAAYELRAEAAMVQALQQVMDTIADRIGRTQTAAAVRQVWDGCLFCLNPRHPGPCAKPGSDTSPGGGRAGGGGGGGGDGGGGAGGAGPAGEFTRGPTPSVHEAAEGANPNFGSSRDNPTYRDAAKAGQLWNPAMGPPPNGAYEENCTNCVQAFEMRMRGYKVEAAPLDVLDKHGYAGGRTHAEIDQQLATAWSLPGGAPHGRSFAGQKWRSFKEIDKEVQGWPEGGRGYVHVGKHVFAVAKVKGKAQYIEPQFSPGGSSRIVTGEYKRKFGGRSGGAKVVRLDDLEPAAGISGAVVAAG